MIGHYAGDGVFTQCGNRTDLKCILDRRSACSCASKGEAVFDAVFNLGFALL